MDSNFEDILKRLGWTTGMHLPVADKGNRILQAQVEALMIRKARATQKFDIEESRCNAFVNHLKIVKQQSQENQNLLTTYRQHLDNQQHKFLLTQSEKASVEQVTRETNKKKNDVENRNEIKKTDLERGMIRMDKLKAESKWDNEALRAWEEALSKRNEDTELLKKFSKEDEKKAKDLETRRQNIQMEAIARNQTLKKVFGDCVMYQQMLGRLGKILQQQKHERKALTKQWQDAIDTLKRRDEKLKQLMKEQAETQDLISEEQERLDEQNNFLKNEINNNKELEQKIEEINAAGCKLHRELNDLIQFVVTLTSEGNSLKRNLIASANYLEKERARAKELSKDIDNKLQRLSQLEKELNNLRKKLEDVKNTSMSAAERTRQLEQIMQDAQRHTKILEQDIERMQGVVFRSQQTINGLRDIGKIKEIEMSSCEISTGLINKNIKSLNNELQKQKEINYDLDFTINQMQSKLDKLEGNTVDEDLQNKQAKIVDLEKEYEAENELKQMLQNQVNSIEDEMRRLTAAIQSDNSQMEVLKDKLQNEVLSFEDGTKQAAASKQRSQQKQVEENLLRLRVNQLENIIKREQNRIFNLQKLKLELETAMRERQIEINTNKEILLAKRRNLDEDKSRLKRDITSRQTKIDQLQKRFHIAIMALGKDEDGQPLSVTHFKIKNAQEKYMLQEEGDKLDAMVKKAEKEILAMENTLKIVNMSNNTYKESLSAVLESDKENEEMRQIEKDVLETTGQLRNKKRQLINKKNHMKELSHTLSNAVDDKISATQVLNLLEEDYSNYQRHEENQKEKHDRVDRHLQTCMKNLDMKSTEKYHKNIMIRQLQEANKSSLQQLAEMSTRHHDITPHINRYVYDHDLQLPHTPKLLFSPSSSSCSTRSSEYYATGPPVSNIFIEFDANVKKKGKSTTSSSKKGKIKRKF